MLVHHEPGFTIKAVDRPDRAHTVSFAFFDLMTDVARFAIRKVHPDMHLFITICASASIVLGDIEYVDDDDEDGAESSEPKKKVPYPNNFIDAEFLETVDEDEVDLYVRLAVPSIFHTAFGNVWLAGIHCPDYTYSETLEESPKEISEPEWRELMVSHLIYHVLQSAASGLGTESMSEEEDAAMDKKATDLTLEFFASRDE